MISFIINIYKKEKFIKMANIKNNNYRKIDCKLINDAYLDFMLSKEESVNYIFSEDCFAAKLNFTNNDTRTIVSDYSWNKSILSDKILDNIGYTGVDNGFINYERDLIGNDEFVELFMNSSFDLSTYNDKFFVTEVNGNTGVLEYPLDKKCDYTAFKGGFYQGFFKIDGDKYQTLPHRIDDEWNINITLRKKDYETHPNILNNRHINNKGIFFYIGTRAENKFWELYKSDSSMEKLKYDDSNEYTSDYSMYDSEVTKHQYHEDEPNPANRDDRYGDVCECLDYFDDEYNPYGNETCSASKNEYFQDDYTGKGTTVGCDCPENDLAIEDEYIQEQLNLDEVKLVDSNGNPLDEKGFYEIETDNKFIIFNQTKNGFTTKTWNEDYKFILTGKTDSPNINYFPYLHHAKGGYDKKDVQKLIEEHSYKYNVFKDIENNALCFKINDDGSISYRYLSTNCEIIEETSQPNIINNDEWANVHIKIVRKSNEQPNECDVHYKQGKMQIYIYVNGYLKLVSKELPEIILKPLNDNSERQEGVPYSMSIGGGTQGLSERILLNYYDITDYELPIEKNFAGTFIGDIKTFSFIPCKLGFSTIFKYRGGF